MLLSATSSWALATWNFGISTLYLDSKEKDDFEYLQRSPKPQKSTNEVLLTSHSLLETECLMLVGGFNPSEKYL